MGVGEKAVYSSHSRESSDFVDESFTINNEVVVIIEMARRVTSVFVPINFCLLSIQKTSWHAELCRQMLYCRVLRSGLRTWNIVLFDIDDDSFKCSHCSDYVKFCVSHE